MATTTITRHGDPTFHYTVTASGSHDALMDSVADQLSSPITSYELYREPDGLCIQHQESYVKSAKELIQQLKDDMNQAEMRRQEAEMRRQEAEMRRQEAETRRQEISIHWETHSRIAQALNDNALSKRPKLAYHRLKAAGHGYLPYLLAAWAINQHIIPVPNGVDQVQLDRFSRKVGFLRPKSLIGDIRSVWNAIPSIARILMITMWLKRPTSRSNIAHPTPSAEQARSLIQLDNLTEAEIELAERVISAAVDKQDNRLFSDE